MLTINALLCYYLLAICLYWQSESMEQLNYVITKTWDNQLPDDRTKIHLQLSLNGNDDLMIRVSAPFYNDPPIPENTSVGSMDKLWEYEVVEVFLLGYDDNYLEVELGPKGQYLLLQLHGYRNVTKYPLHLDKYDAKINGNEWSGEALIPSTYLPQQLNKFNAYAIHGSNESRIYMSLFPTPFGLYPDPDFHRLEYFAPIKLK